MSIEFPQKLTGTVNTGILKNSDEKKLEANIVDRLRSFGKKFSRREISELMASINTSNSLSELRDKISQEPKLANNPELADEIIHLAESVRHASKEDLTALRELVKTLKDRSSSPVGVTSFPLSQNKLVKYLEKSELGDNILVDAVGTSVGLAQSILLIAKFLLELIRDLFLLPRDLISKSKV